MCATPSAPIPCADLSCASMTVRIRRAPARTCQVLWALRTSTYAAAHGTGRIPPGSRTALQSALTLLTDDPNYHQVQDCRDSRCHRGGQPVLAVARHRASARHLDSRLSTERRAPAISWRTRYDTSLLHTTGFLSHLPDSDSVDAGRGQHARTWFATSTTTCGQTHPRSSWAVKSTGSRPHRGGLATRQLVQANPTRAIVLATGNYRTPTSQEARPSQLQREVVHSGNFKTLGPSRRDFLVVAPGIRPPTSPSISPTRRAPDLAFGPQHHHSLVRRAIGPLPSDIFLELFAWGTRGAPIRSSGSPSA